MAIDKLIPQYLNSDTDQKLVKSVEMTDNLNVRVSNDAEGTDGVIKNVKGTEVVGAKSASDVYPSGDNRVIGSVANEKNKEVLFLLWNENNNHGIYRLDMTTGKYQKLYEDSVLNFQKFGYADCDVIVNEDEETLFYWTDNVNPPMKVNVNRLIQSDYPNSFYSGTNQEKLEALTVVKRPPQNPITFEYFTDSSLNQNNLKDNLFQFAYQYIYKDGEISAISPYSAIAYSTSQTLRGIISEGTSVSDNAIKLFIETGNDNVEKVRILGRIGNQGQLFQIKEVDNEPNLTFDFYNDGVYSFVSSDEASKTFDNVPLKAKALSLTGNRLMYGNYIEGYDNVDTQTESYPVYKPLPNTYSIDSDINPIVAGNEVETRYQTNDSGFSLGTDDVSFNLFLSDLPNTIKAGTLVSFDVQLGVTESLVFFNGDNSVGVSNAVSNIEVTWDNDGSPQTSTISVGGANSQLVMAASPFTVSFSKIYDTNTSKSTLVNDILLEINNRAYTTTVSPDLSKTLHSVSAAGFDLWLAGKCDFFIQNGIYDSNSETIRFDVNFYGADLFISKLKYNNKDRDIISGGNASVPSFDEYTSVYSGFVYIEYSQYRNFFTSSSIAEDLELSNSFKTKANHEFGIVYYDDRNRSGGVNKLPITYVSGYSEPDRLGNIGAVEIDFRIKHQAPSWANKWQLVYTKNTTYDEFLQYSVSEAFVATNTDSSTTITGNEGNRIYVSARSLEGKENSYKDGKGARIEYQYQEGDILRVLKYEDGFSRRPLNYEFRILGYEFLQDDESNPLVLSAQRGFRQTGWFFVLSNEDYNGFSYKDVLANSDFWGQNCLVEICRPKKNTEDRVYYEIAQVYDVVNGVHRGDRDTSTTTNAAISISYAGVDKGFGESLYRFYIGDELNIGTHIITIESIRYQSNGYIGYEFSYKSPVQITAGSYLCTIENYTEAVLTCTNGDVYFRPRSIRYNPFDSINSNYDETSSDSTVYQLEYVEDSSLNDFFSSNSCSIGRAQAYSPEFKQIRRRASVTYSDAYIIDSERLSLSSFNLSLANWSDLDLSNGSIESMVSRGDALTVIQNTKASQVPVGRNLIEYTNGSSGVTVSKNVLGIPSYYAGDYGTQNPESVVERFGVIYYVDARSSKVLRLSADGITPISDKGMDSFFQENFSRIMSSSSNIRIVGGFDPDNGEYIITVEPNYVSTVTIGSNSYEIALDNNDDPVVNNITYTNNTVIWNLTGNLWNTYCGNWDDAGNGIIFIDELWLTQSVLIDSELEGSGATINVILTDSNYSFSATVQLNLSTGVITFPATTCEGDSISVGVVEEQNSGFTIAYKHKEGVWGSKYSFKPTSYVNINNELYSFFDTASGVMWKHNVNETRNNFYGTQYSSMFESVSNFNPSMIKVFEAIGVEGDGNWSASLSNSKQLTTIDLGEFDEREGHRYAMIPRDTLVSSSHQIYLGRVDSISGNNITFTTPINRIPFTIGDTLKTASGSTGLVVSGISDRKTIVCTSAVSNVNVGDNVFVEHVAKVDGDPMRDVFLKIRMSSADTDAFEVHALSVSFDRSMVHNDRVN